jgi:two-component system, NarL family, response regulator NreC
VVVVIERTAQVRPAATIVVADDHRLVRSAVRKLLDAEVGLQVVGEAGDLGDALRKVRAYKPNVLVLDLGMPGGSSLEAIPAILRTSPGTAVVVLTMHSDAVFARQALRAGALGFVLKDAAETELVDAVRAASDGHRYLNAQLGARIAAEPDIPVGAPDHLSDRELQVLRLIALRHSNLEIAEQLCLSVRTVESHRSHIQHKVQHTSRAELVAYAREHGLI